MQPYFSLASGHMEASIALVEESSYSKKLCVTITDNKTLQNQSIQLTDIDAKLLADVIYCISSAKL